MIIFGSSTAALYPVLVKCRFFLKTKANKEENFQTAKKENQGSLPETAPIPWDRLPAALGGEMGPKSSPLKGAFRPSQPLQAYSPGWLLPLKSAAPRLIVNSGVHAAFCGDVGPELPAGT